MQQGIKKAKGEIIVLLDADTLVDEYWLAKLIKPIESGKADCTNGNEFPLNKSLFNNYFMIEKYYGKQFLNQKSTHGPGGIAFKRKLAKKIGIAKMFDSSIRAGVDHNLGKRILEAKKTILFVKEAKTKTFYNKTIKGFVKDGLRWKKAYFSLISKWKLFQILIFNLIIISSLLIFLLTFLFSYDLIFSLPFTIYLSYLLFQCITSAIISSNISFIFYLPIYLFIGIIDRIIAIYVLTKKLFGFEILQNINFKGER